MQIEITWEDVQLVAKQNPLFASQLENAALKRMLAEKKGHSAAPEARQNGRSDSQEAETQKPVGV